MGSTVGVSVNITCMHAVTAAHLTLAGEATARPAVFHASYMHDYIKNKPISPLRRARRQKYGKEMFN